jgi:hypothetical protein
MTKKQGKASKRVCDLPAKRLGDEKTKRVKGGMPQGPPNRTNIPPGSPI